MPGGQDTLVGKDVFAYAVTATDALSNAGTQYVLLGKWESWELTIKEKWADVTPSDALEDYARQLTFGWTFKATNFVKNSGSVAIALIQATAYVLVVLSPGDGTTITLRGGIDEASLKVNQEGQKEDLSLRSVGPLGGFPSIVKA
jgi:hypothetical protein